MAKLLREKILQLTHNVGKTFVDLLNKNKSSFHVLKENFRSLLKIFSLVSFIPYGSYTLLILAIYLTMLVVPLLHTTTSAYYAMPDNHYHPINDNTYTLQHYLNNTNKYFTSNTQLHFLPGQYYLNNDLIIQGVSNFSLIGNRTNEVINTVINCTLPAGIAVVGSSNIVVANIVMNDTHHSALYTACILLISIELQLYSYIHDKKIKVAK